MTETIERPTSQSAKTSYGDLRDGALFYLIRGDEVDPDGNGAFRKIGTDKAMRLLDGRVIYFMWISVVQPGSLLDDPWPNTTVVPLQMAAA